MSPFLLYFNYAIRGVLILLGIVLFSGIFLPPQRDEMFTKTMGIVMILFGIYRIAQFHFAYQRQKIEEANEQFTVNNVSEGEANENEH